jgi:hypothetical protein
MGNVDEIIEATASGLDHPVFAMVTIAIVAFVIFLVLSGRLRKTSTGFELGDNTAF